MSESPPGTVPRPSACPFCGSHDLDGPWGVVWFCDGCGRTIRPEDTRPVDRDRIASWVRFRRRR